MQVLCAEVKLKATLPDIFEHLLSHHYPAYLDSSLTHPDLGRYSYLAANPFIVLSAKNDDVSISRRNARDARDASNSLCWETTSHKVPNPFDCLQAILRDHQSVKVPGLPPFQGGAIGYFGYDLGRRLEQVPEVAFDDFGLPDLQVGIYQWVLAYDNLTSKAWVIVNRTEGDRSRSEEALHRVTRLVESARPQSQKMVVPRKNQEVRCNFTRTRYLEAVSRAKDRIAAGEIYEVCLSQRFDTAINEHPWQLYQRLRSVSPVPYGAYLGFPDSAVLSASPEMFLRMEEGSVETRPIKGTRPRGETRDVDRQLAVELRASEKERAENLMIVDLLRNDLGRVCRVGSIRVPELFRVESYSTVHQLVSTVQGELSPDANAIDLLKACFPGGSVTGCPKIRAMEIIDLLEPTRRGVYCGAIGFVGFNGEMDTSIAIRTIIAKEGRAYVQVGGAIVSDSDPDEEYQETLDKAQAALVALQGKPIKPFVGIGV